MKIALSLQKISLQKEIPSKASFIKWVRTALSWVSQEPPEWASTMLIGASSFELTLRVVDEAESAHYNVQYRHKAGPTNVLSFPTLPIVAWEETTYHLGDIVICAPLMTQEAVDQNKPVLLHWAHLTVHGVLHLLGYDHQVEEEAVHMERLEATILKQLGLRDASLGSCF